jgi:uncharacterized protein YdhG (YjbR/CyaY superfamily)
MTRSPWQTRPVTTTEIDAYLAALSDPDRRALDELRAMILEVVPDAEQCISYGLPGFRVRGKVVAGFGAFAQHLSYFPHSGSVFDALGGALDGYERTKSSLHFTADEPLTAALVRRLVETKLHELGF